MRRITVICAVLAVLSGVFAVPAAAAPGGGWAVVNGENDAVCGDGLAGDGYSCDLDRLQAAVDAGGKIRLKGVFNLGEPAPSTAQTVFVTKDVVLRGQGATIFGGYNSLTIGIAGHIWAFEAFADWVFLPELRVPVAVTVEGIRFENFLNTAIYDVASTDLTVKNNEFIDAMSVGYWWSIFGETEADARAQSYAVLVSASAMFFEDGPAREDISGKVTIAGNYVDGNAREEAGGFPEPWGGEWKGLNRVFRVTTAAADVTIRNNVMQNFHQAPIILDGVKGESVVRNNVITDADATDSGDPGNPMFQIFEIGWGPVFGFPGLDPSESTTTIRNNEIVSNHFVAGVFNIIDSDEVVIRNNDMSLLGGSLFFADFVGTTDSVMRNNEIDGSGCVIAFFEADLDLGISSDRNLFRNNDTSGYTTDEDECAGFYAEIDYWYGVEGFADDYFADADSTGNITYLGEGETYFDAGNNTWIPHH